MTESEIKNYPYVAVLGPTGSGKSDLALRLAEEMDGEIISCDSVQVFKGFDIGSAKATLSEQERIPHHLINVANYWEDYDAFRYRTEALDAIEQITERGRVPIVVGGTGLYFRALTGNQIHELPDKDDNLRASYEDQTTSELYAQLKEKDPMRALQLHINDRLRIIRALECCMLLGKPVSQVFQDTHQQALQVYQPSAIWHLNPPRDELIKRIEKRSYSMLEQGLKEEVESLLNSGCPITAKPMQSIGYYQMCQFLTGALSENQLAPSIITATCQYAKRQRTWFKKLF